MARIVLSPDIQLDLLNCAGKDPVGCQIRPLQPPLVEGRAGLDGRIWLNILETQKAPVEIVARVSEVEVYVLQVMAIGSNLILHLRLVSTDMLYVVTEFCKDFGLKLAGCLPEARYEELVPFLTDLVTIGNVSVGQSLHDEVEEEWNFDHRFTLQCHVGSVSSRVNSGDAVY